jgi:CHRD domain
MTYKSIAAALLAGAAFVVGGCETVAESVAETYKASLTGAQEVPGPGDPDGSGNGEVSVVDATDNVCYEINDVRGIDPATAAHIHRGATGVAGPPVVTILPPTDGESQGCVQVPSGIANEIKANPSNFYINVHNGPYPEGAIRGQLRDLD